MCARHLKGGLLSTNVATSSKDSCFDHLLGPARATRAAALARAETIIVLRNAETNLLWQSCEQVIQGRFVFEAHAASCVCHRHLRTLFLARHPDNIVVPSSAVRIFVPRNVEEIIIAQNVLKTSGGIPVAKTLWIRSISEITFEMLPSQTSWSIDFWSSPETNAVPGNGATQGPLRIEILSVFSWYTMLQ